MFLDSILFILIFSLLRIKKYYELDAGGNGASRLVRSCPHNIKYQSLLTNELIYISAQI
jgi:hypothetical protein